jgi:hypothetical protein
MPISIDVDDCNRGDLAVRHAIGEGLQSTKAVTRAAARIRALITSIAVIHQCKRHARKEFFTPLAP